MSHREVRRTAGATRFVNHSDPAATATFGYFGAALERQWQADLQNGPVKILVEGGKKLKVPKVIPTFKGQKQ